MYICTRELIYAQLNPLTPPFIHTALHSHRLSFTPPFIHTALHSHPNPALPDDTPQYMIDPRARWKLYWDIVCGIFIVFSVIVIPYRLFFRARIAPAAQYLDYFIDALFFFDMVFSFRTGFFAKQGHLVMSPRRIFKGYIRTWFLVDFFSTMPLDTIIFYAFDVPRQQLRTIKLIRILRLARLAKLAKLMTRGSIQVSDEACERVAEA